MAHHVFAETDDVALLEAWGSNTPEPRANGVDEGHEFFLVYDENDGEPRPAAGREMTKQFRLMFVALDAELQGFKASLEEAGFAPVFSDLVKYRDSPDDTMTTELPLQTDYQAARAQLEGAISKKLAMVEYKTLASLPQEVADDMQGGYVRDVAVLLSPFTPDYYAELVASFDGDAAEHAFLDFCIQELNEYHAYLALVAWPNAVGREYAWPALSFPLEQQWADKVSIREEAKP